jgi:hypothetical protein
MLLAQTDDDDSAAAHCLLVRIVALDILRAAYVIGLLEHGAVLAGRPGSGAVIHPSGDRDDMIHDLYI